MRIGTRASALALAQAELVATALSERSAIAGFELVPLVSSGDRGRARADKSRWVLELEDALLRGEIDLAVHSAKDVPTQLRDGLALLGAPARAAAEDVLCGAEGLDALPARARVGTSSLRRGAQLRAAREDLEVVSMRGNVDTRLRKLAQGDTAQLRAIVLARAALQRLEREHEAGAVLDPRQFVPAPGQGILALQGRAGDARTRAAAEAISDEPTLACLLAERAVARALSASCHTPLGAHALLAGDGRLRLRAWVGLPDGSAWLSDERCGEPAAAEALGEAVAQRMMRAGAEELLRASEQLAVGA
ncbi:MAG: hydroxymethylbilane synthase [Actinobacteria bacterium]|nr:MAG: hydroxymethylbilane synthase [Actinomycetota bacterium]